MVITICATREAQETAELRATPRPVYQMQTKNTHLRVSHFLASEKLKAINFESAWKKCLNSGIYRSIDDPDVAAVMTG